MPRRDRGRHVRRSSRGRPPPRREGPDKAKVARFGPELVPLVTSGPPGVTGFAGGRPKAQEIIGYWPALVTKERAPLVTVFES